jgi:hypothetical protein
MKMLAALMALVGFAGIWGSVFVILRAFWKDDFDLVVFLRFVVTAVVLYGVGVIAFRALDW